MNPLPLIGELTVLHCATKVCTMLSCTVFQLSKVESITLYGV